MNRRMFFSSIATALAAVKLAPVVAPSAASFGIRQPATLVKNMPTDSLFVTSGGRGYVLDASGYDPHVLALARYAHDVSAREFTDAYRRSIIEHVGE